MTGHDGRRHHRRHRARARRPRRRRGPGPRPVPAAARRAAAGRHRPDRVPRRAVRPRARLGALPRGPRRARPVARSCRRRSTSSSRPGRCAPSRDVPQPDRPRHGRARPSSPTAARRRSAATCARCSPARRSGASCSASPAPAPTSPACRPGRSATATSGSSTARRCGPRSRTWPAGGCWSPAPTPTRRKHKGLTVLRRRHARARGRGAAARQMTGEAEFNEVYFTDVRIPDAERLGDVGEGWRVSLTTLMNERVVDRRPDPHPGAAGSIGELDEDLDEPPPAATTAATRDRVMRLWVQAEVLRLTNIRASQNRGRGHARPRGLGRQAGDRPSPTRTSCEFAVDLLGRRRDAATRRLPDGPAPTTALDCEQPAEGVPARRGPTRSRAARPRS